MNWTKEQPLRPGYYWLRGYVFKGMEHFKAQAEPVIVRLTSPANDWQELQVENSTFKDNDLEAPISDIIEGEWYGPLNVPSLHCGSPSCRVCNEQFIV